MKVKIEKLDNFGKGICYINNLITFIDNALPEEIVDIKIINKKSKYQEAIVKKYIEKSPLRIESECPYYKYCGGCHLNHINFEEENNFKIEKVKNILNKMSGINKDIIKEIIFQERDYYRNKITLHGKDKELGLYQEKTNSIIPIKECLIVNHKINKIIDFLNNNNDNIKKAVIKTSNDNNQVMIDITGKIKNIEELKSKVNVLKYNDKFITKEKQIETTIGNKKYKESINSFLQINNTLTKELYDEVKRTVKENHPDKVLDLYCGIATIGIYISEECKEVIGVDSNPSNIEDAKDNIKLNNIKNITLINDKVENVIDTFNNIDLIIVDPPRAGLDQKTRDYLRIINPKTIIYISCEPITLGRDLKELKEKYTINTIKLFNMFPRTYHVECVTLLCRKTL